MAPKHTGVMAADNQCEVQFRILSVKTSESFPDKQELEILLLDARSLAGPDFATRRVGQTSRAFTFDPSVRLSEGSVIRAKAEYLGDARAGVFKLTDLRSDGG